MSRKFFSFFTQKNPSVGPEIFPDRASGQAIVEYILILVIVVSVGLGLATKFFKPAQKWADFYLGTYTQCLLDQGALPGIAGGTPTECDQLAQDHKMADGNNSVASGSKSGSGSKDGSSSGGGGQDSGSNSRGRTSEGGDGAHIGGKHSKGASKKTASSGGGGDTFNTPKGGDTTNQENISHVNSNAKGQNISSYSRGGSNSYREEHIRATGYAGSAVADEKATETMEERAMRQNQEEGMALKPKRLSIKKVVRKTAAAEESSNDWSFGNLLRYGIMIIIIIAIIYVVSTQVNSVMKSREK